jgi:uncharacterized RDD family membrane protein YckC
MQPGERGDGLVVATPERVAFEYEVAGLGSRFLAQAIDVLLLLLLFFFLSLAALLLNSLSGNGRLSLLIWVILSFALFLLYFPILEGIWGGQTVGKRLLRLRVLGDRGEPVTVTQVAIRNLIRLVDFLPLLYGVGIVTLFVQGGSKRLGDFAAGTVVVRDRERIRLKDLVREPAPTPVPAETRPAASIWAQAGTALGNAGTRAVGTPPPLTPTTPYEDAVRRMPDALRRFVLAYAGRRHELAQTRRQQLAEQVSAPLAELLRGEVAAFGPLAVLDGLASLMYARPMVSSPLPPPSSPLPPASRPLPPSV